MGQFRLLQVFRPFQKLIPEVAAPEGRRVSFK